MALSPEFQAKIAAARGKQHVIAEAEPAVIYKEPPRPTLPPPAIDVNEARIAHWQGAMFEEARFSARDPAYHESDVLLMQLARVANNAPRTSALAWPTGIDMNELEGALTVVVDRALAANGNGKAPAKLEETYSDRRAVDAYEAHQAMVADQRGYVWEGFIKEGCTMIVSGLMGAGKSTFAMNLARAWAKGEPFLGRTVKPSKTLVVVSPKEYEAWAETFGFWQLAGSVYLVESTKAHFKNAVEQVQWFVFQMETLGSRTFVLDTLFDFYGMPANNSGDQNRIVMNEQTPFLQMVRERMYGGLVLGHPPKSEASALVSRDPEESFGGHTAWTAQHRMRGTIRRNSGANAFITGKGGYGDQGVLSEEMLLFDEQTRLVSLGGPFKNYLGVVAMPTIVQALDGWMSRSDIEKKIGKRKEWILAGLKEGIKQGTIKHNGKDGRSRKYALPDEPKQDELFG